MRRCLSHVRFDCQDAVRDLLHTPVMWVHIHRGVAVNRRPDIVGIVWVCVNVTDIDKATTVIQA